MIDSILSNFFGHFFVVDQIQFTLPKFRTFIISVTVRSLYDFNSSFEKVNLFCTYSMSKVNVNFVLFSLPQPTRQPQLTVVSAIKIINEEKSRINFHNPTQYSNKTSLLPPSGQHTVKGSLGVLCADSMKLQCKR